MPEANPSCLPGVPPPPPAARFLLRGLDPASEVETGGSLVSFLPARTRRLIDVPSSLGTVAVVSISEAFVSRVCGGPSKSWRHAVGERWPRIADAARWLRLSGESREGPAGAQLVEGLLVRLVAVTFGAFERRADDSWLPTAALGRIEARSASAGANRLTVGALAEEAGLGPSAFLRGFRGSTGLTPREFLIRIRMDRVAFLLRTTELPVAVIAERTSLAGVAHLTQQSGAASGCLRDATEPSPDRTGEHD